MGAAMLYRLLSVCARIRVFPPATLRPTTHPKAYPLAPTFLRPLNFPSKVFVSIVCLRTYISENSDV